jgi:hypothetical protein
MPSWSVSGLTHTVQLGTNKNYLKQERIKTRIMITRLFSPVGAAEL